MKGLFTFSLAVLFTFASFAKSMPANYFPASYDQARSEFLLLAQETGGELTRFHIPSQTDDDLSLEALYLAAPDSQKLVIIISGVHGAEGPAGSAAQLDFLKNDARKWREKGLSIILLHAINPHGYRYKRRVSENNIDLNRNFSLDPDLYKTPNPSYDKLQSVLNPQGELTSYFLTTSRATLGLLRAITLRGVSTDEIRNASVGGQYNTPKGIYFGGTQPEIQVAILTYYLSPILRHYADLLVLDIHTGLGEKGVLYLISSSSQTQRDREALLEIFSRPSEETYELTTSTDPGFYPVTGDITDFFHQLAPNKRVVSVTVEFGTMGLGLVSQLQTLNRLIAENQLAMYGARTAKIRNRVQERFNELFNPQDNEWQQQVYQRMRFLYDDSLESFLELN
jgi:predicted deacylase